MDRVKIERREKRRWQSIEAWMLAIVRDCGVERFDDLHIDQIDAQWKSRKQWIQGALTAHWIALKLRDLHGLPVTLAAAFALKIKPRRAGVDLQTLQELEARLDDSTPPSLYLFWRGKEPWASDGSFQELESPAVGHPQQGLRWLYREAKPEDFDEYWRAVFCEG